ncbi:PssD/Cps14F family polysaccharide biosynthesis glycosyltransferase [Priestia flexa]|uniref:PssD/Cps14F family polysaccharide biosynthesis glycosyltransferase n=1 Tax=Priestia flexa TaxID=86664 RepID=UPI0011A84CF5|nr:PssD/Cps14F family polysaccharide biosynthesis glycosyltransferase [Priestia flexa]MCG7314004.1 UDP-N-acetylglucosamine--LPS N-acetylglucosamine transferase [Priestia flexa]UZW66168.1 UDP-N-acetylglucosamine transferase subunit ALG14 [Priestia flexa]
MKICFPTSSGGHLTHLLLLKSWYENHERVWVTFNKKDANSSLESESVYWCYYPTNRNIFNLIRNTFLSIKVLKIEKPDVIVSTGAAVAIPFFIIGKLMGKKTVYIEVYDRISKPTLTGKIVYPFTDLFIVQWKEQKEFYKKAKLLGEII